MFFQKLTLSALIIFCACLKTSFGFDIKKISTKVPQKRASNQPSAQCLNIEELIYDFQLANYGKDENHTDSKNIDEHLTYVQFLDPPEPDGDFKLETRINNIGETQPWRDTTRFLNDSLEWSQTGCDTVTLKYQETKKGKPPQDRTETLKITSFSPTKLVVETSSSEGVRKNFRITSSQRDEMQKYWRQKVISSITWELSNKDQSKDQFQLSIDASLPYKVDDHGELQKSSVRFVYRISLISKNKAPLK